MSQSDPVSEFNRFLEKKNWHRELNEKIASYIEKGEYSNQGIDELLMTVTKLVEGKLKDAIIRRTGSSIPEDRSYGEKLLNLSVNSHLIASRDDPLYHLLYWFFKTPRNTSHHQFTQFPDLTLMTFISTTNYALNDIERLTRSPEDIDAIYHISYDSRQERLEIHDVSMTKMGEPLRPDTKVEAFLKFPMGQVKTIQLRQSEGRWHGEYDARGDLRGTVTLTLGGFTGNGKSFTVPSGSHFVRSFQAGDTCPYCGNRMEHAATSCPFCGRR